MSTVDAARNRIKAPKAPSPPPAALRRRHEVHSREVEGFRCHTVAPRGSRAKRAAVYLHGGAYINGMSRQHWSLVSKLADAGVRVEVPDYGVVPRHTYREAYPFLTAVYRDLLTEVDARSITVAGDSAGGGLALGFAQSLFDAELPQPRKLLLIAPWLDLTLSCPGLAAAEARDPWLSSVGLIEAGLAWAGGEDDPTDPRLSPINGRLAGLAPMHVFIGTRDLLHPDTFRLRARAIDEDVPIHMSECEGAVHCHPLTPTPEGRSATRHIVELVAR